MRRPDKTTPPVRAGGAENNGEASNLRRDGATHGATVIQFRWALRHCNGETCARGGVVTMARSQNLAWRLAYALEERRQLYAARGQLFRQAGACIELTALRLFWR